LLSLFEELVTAYSLRIGRIVDFDPARSLVINGVSARFPFCNNAFEISGAHLLKESAMPLVSR
jgi:hypothetical protein